jgi:hypothetical protein
MGMFLINDTSAIMLFDSRASHSFISTAYVEKHNLPLPLLKCQVVVSSLGGDMPTRQLCPKVNLKIRRYGLYKYTMMSFGLTNAPAYFLYLMNKVFHGVSG